MELIRDNVKVEWEAIGEGFSGDYNPEDLRDVELLRFYVSVLRNGVWEEKEDASYCTLFPVSATDEDKMAGLQLLMENFHAALADDPDASVKKLGEQLSWISLGNIVNVTSGMSLHQFLAFFDFDYDIVSPGDEREARIRGELIEDGYLTSDVLDKDLICLVDRQNAYFGDIDKERYPVSQASVSKIVDRMDAYIQDYIVCDFEAALEAREVDPGNMSLSDMVSMCKELGVGTGEVSYWVAGAIVDPSRIVVPEARQLERDLSLEEKIADAQAAARLVSGSFERDNDCGREEYEP